MEEIILDGSLDFYRLRWEQEKSDHLSAIAEKDKEINRLRVKLGEQMTATDFNHETVLSQAANIHKLERELAANDVTIENYRNLVAMKEKTIERLRNNLVTLRGTLSQIPWDVDNSEQKAISKGSAPYSSSFRAAIISQYIGEAIDAFVDPEYAGRSEEGE